MARRLERKTYVRTNPRSRLALKRVVAELEASGRLRFEGGPITQECLVNALWLWAEGQGVARLEDQIAPFVAQLDALVAAPAGDEGEVERPPTPPMPAPPATPSRRVYGPDGGELPEPPSAPRRAPRRKTR